MKRFPYVLLAVFLFAVIVMGQSKPFDDFRKAVKDERGGFAGNKEKLSSVFAVERKRLGADFEKELWIYLGDDADKHYWIAFFVSSKPYLHGTDPLPELAFRIRTRAVELLKNKGDERDLGRKVTMYRMLAVSSKLANNQVDAVRFRDAAEQIMARFGDDLVAYIGARSEYDKCVYENVGGSIENCDPNPPPKEKVINAGWMNSRALNFSNPSYPANVKDRRLARVEVRITTDVNGSVILAEVIRGPGEFHNAALDAARKLTFPPTSLSGVPTKVSGWVSFEFKP